MEEIEESIAFSFWWYFPGYPCLHIVPTFLLFYIFKNEKGFGAIEILINIIIMFTVLVPF